MTTTPDRSTPEARTRDHAASDVRTSERGAADARTPELPAQEARTRQAPGTAQTGSPTTGSPQTGVEQAAGEPVRTEPALAGPAGAEPRPARDLPRWVRWTVLPLMVIVPVGYVVISADQSRDSGQSNEAEAAARQLTAGSPSSLQQRIYQVEFPSGATGTGYLETNSWDTSVLYAQFTTTAGGLDTFLAGIGTSRTALHEGLAAIPPDQARAAGWNLDPNAGRWVGITLRQPGDKPDHAIAVDLGHPDAPTVYVVSTVNFQHGFGGG